MDSALCERLYLGRVLETVPRVLTHLDRELFSPTYGSFDRSHWGWGATDVSNADFQRLTLPLAYVYSLDEGSNPYFRRRDLKEWIEGALLFTCREQAPNGSFTQWFPNDNSVVSAGFVTHDLLLVSEILSDVLARPVVENALTCAVRAGHFLLRYEERHGFNSNHQIGIAAALLDVYAHTGDAAFRERAVAILRRVFARQMASGAFYEYMGADPGYQSLGLAYLAACHERLPSAEIRRALERGVSFADGTISSAGGPGGFGSRGTRLLFPSGFEIASRLGIGRSTLLRVRRIIARDRCVTNRNTDIHNLSPILCDYVRAALRASTLPPELEKEAGEAQDLFCADSTLFAFHRGDCSIRGRLNGGMVQIEDQAREDVIFASAGYMLTWRHGRAFTGVLNGVWDRWESAMTFRTSAHRPNRLRASPGRLLALRLFQLTLGRFMAANLWVKRLMARRLIFRERPVAVAFERTISWEDDSVEVRDRIRNHLAETVAVRHCAEGYISFMGSARYWDAGLAGLAGERVRMWVNGQRWETDSGVCREWPLAAASQLEIVWTIALTGGGRGGAAEGP